MNRIVYESVKLCCKPAFAFTHFTKNELLVNWLCLRADVTPSEGGTYELFWDLQTRTENSTIGCKITAICKDELLAFEWKSPSQFKSFANLADPLTHVVVSLIPAGNGTRVHLVHSGWRSSKEWEEARRWQQRAWSCALSRLKKIITQQVDGSDVDR